MTHFTRPDLETTATLLDDLEHTKQALPPEELEYYRQCMLSVVEARRSAQAEAPQIYIQ